MGPADAFKYKVVLYAECGTPFNIMLGIDTEEEAKALMTALVDKVATKEERFITFDNLVVDRTKIVAYQVMRYPVPEAR